MSTRRYKPKGRGLPGRTKLTVESLQDGDSVVWDASIKQWVAGTPNGGESVLTLPESGELSVQNLYVNAATGNLVVVYDDDPNAQSPGLVRSDPPPGDFRVVSVAVSAATGRLVINYDDTPTP